MIRLCPNCKSHEFQDKMYGEKMRVYNVNAKYTKARCTICLRVVDLSNKEIKEEKEGE